MTDITDLMEEMEESSSAVESVDQGGLLSIAKLAIRIREKETLIQSLEAQIKDEKKSLLKLSDEDLPSLLAELGMASFTLEDGSKVEVKSTYGASIRVSDRDEAFDWLREKGYGDIIKNTVSCQFGKGDDDLAASFRNMAEQQGYDAQQKTEVHPQTLRAFVKERVEAGDEFPMELFGAWIGQRATIKRGK